MPRSHAWAPVALLALTAAVPVPAAGDGLRLASAHAVVGDLERGDVLYAKHADVAVPIASLTKLMTALVVLDGGQPLDEWLPIVDWNASYGKNRYSRLRVGSEATRGELLRVALMSSENLAAHNLARHYPGGLEAFVAAMNDKARALGMTATRFDDPTGLSTGDRSTALDLWKLVQAAYGYDTVREYSTTFQHHVTFHKPRYTLGFGNTNPLTAASRWDVALTKTGYLAEAGRCLVMVADVDGRPVAMVLLNSFGRRTPLGDVSRVRRWLQTGSGGVVAGPALDYERRVSAALDATAAGGSADSH